MRNVLNLVAVALLSTSTLALSSPGLRGIAKKPTRVRAQREQDADAQIHKTPAQVEGALRGTVARSERDNTAANLAEPHARAPDPLTWDSFVPAASDFLVGCADPKAMEDTSTGLKVYAGKYERTTDGFGQCGSFGKGGRTGGNAALSSNKFDFTAGAMVQWRINGGGSWCCCMYWSLVSNNPGDTDPGWGFTVNPDGGLYSIAWSYSGSTVLPQDTSLCSVWSDVNHEEKTVVVSVFESACDDIDGKSPLTTKVVVSEDNRWDAISQPGRFRIEFGDCYSKELAWILVERVGPLLAESRTALTTKPTPAPMAAPTGEPTDGPTGEPTGEPTLASSGAMSLSWLTIA